MLLKSYLIIEILLQQKEMKTKREREKQDLIAKHDGTGGVIRGNWVKVNVKSSEHGWHLELLGRGNRQYQVWALLV